MSPLRRTKVVPGRTPVSTAEPTAADVDSQLGHTPTVSRGHLRRWFIETDDDAAMLVGLPPEEGVEP